jgi:hypothetical protein
LCRWMATSPNPMFGRQSERGWKGQGSSLWPSRSAVMETTPGCSAMKLSTRSILERHMKYARLRSVIAGATLMFCICCADGSLLHAETPDDANASKSWTSSTEQYSGSANPIRTKESRTQNGNRTVDTQVLERKGIEGDYEPYLVVERETIKVDSTTVKIVERSYAPGTLRSAPIGSGD